MPFRRRPLLRAAAVGSIGYASYKAGKGASQAAAQQQQQRASPPAAAPPAQADPTQVVQALTQLKSLLDSGALTQDEFDRAKKSLLESAG
jgi:membrane protease subunit (stomatin/prohibitin family)